MARHPLFNDKGAVGSFLRVILGVIDDLSVSMPFSEAFERVHDGANNIMFNGLGDYLIWGRDSATGAPNMQITLDLDRFRNELTVAANELGSAHFVLLKDQEGPSRGSNGKVRAEPLIMKAKDIGPMWAEDSL